GGVEMGGDNETKMLEVVAGMADQHEIVARHDAAQAQSELGAADPAAQRDDQATPCHAHRNTSSSAGRIREAPGAAGCDHVSPRTSTAGRPSSAWPTPGGAAL